MKSDFEVEYVPPDQFGEKEWYEPMRNGIRWFYHRPRTRPLLVDPEALDGTLDDGIVPVVAAARAQGLATLTCTGYIEDPTDEYIKSNLLETGRFFIEEALNPER